MENIFIASFVRKKKKKNFSNVSLKNWCAGAVNLIRKKITLDSSGARSFCRLFFSSFSFLSFFLFFFFTKFQWLKSFVSVHKMCWTKIEISSPLFTGSRVYFLKITKWRYEGEEIRRHENNFHFRPRYFFYPPRYFFIFEPWNARYLRTY